MRNGCLLIADCIQRRVTHIPQDDRSSRVRPCQTKAEEEPTRPVRRSHRISAEPSSAACTGPGGWQRHSVGCIASLHIDSSRSAADTNLARPTTGPCYQLSQWRHCCPGTGLGWPASPTGQTLRFNYKWTWIVALSLRFLCALTLEQNL